MTESSFDWSFSPKDFSPLSSSSNIQHVNRQLFEADVSSSAAPDFQITFSNQQTTKADDYVVEETCMAIWWRNPQTLKAAHNLKLASVLSNLDYQTTAAAEVDDNLKMESVRANLNSGAGESTGKKRRERPPWTRKYNASEGDAASVQQTGPSTENNNLKTTSLFNNSTPDFKR